MRIVIVAALATTGCNQVYDLDRTRLRDAAPPIDAVPDAATCAGGATPLLLTAPLLADAVLIDPNGGNEQPFGLNPSIYLNYGTSIRSVGLWRFDLSQITHAPASWLGMRIILEWLPADDDCGTGCKKCDALEETGVMELYPVRDDWDESTTTWDARINRALASAWNEPGAGGNDRGGFLTRATHAPRQAMSFALGRDEITVAAPWIATQQLSFVVVPKANPGAGNGGARMIVPALPPRASCSPPSPPARVEIDVCP